MSGVGGRIETSGQRAAVAGRLARVSIGLALACSAAACDASEAQPGQGAPGWGVPSATPVKAASNGAATLFRKQVVMDRQGWGQPVEAQLLLIPEGWRFQGEVQWKGGGVPCMSSLALPVWTATSPDGAISIGTQPGVRVTNYPVGDMQSGGGTCALGEGGPPEAFIRNWIMRLYRPDGRIEAIRQAPYPEERLVFAQAMQQQAAAQGGQAIPWSVVVRSSGSGGDEVRFLDGVTMGWRSPAPDIQPTISMSQNIGNMFVRAPRERMAEALRVASVIIQSRALSPAWQMAVGRVQQNIARINLEGGRRRGEIMAQANREIGEIRMQGWRELESIRDAGHADTVRTIREVTEGYDPLMGERREFDSIADGIYVNEKGEYLVMEEPGFEPGELYPQHDWRPLTKVRGE